MGFILGKEGEQGVTPGRDPGKVNIPLNFLPEMPVGGQAIRIPKIKPLQLNANLDLVGSYPVRQRHM